MNPTGWSHFSPGTPDSAPLQWLLRAGMAPASPSLRLVLPLPPLGLPLDVSPVLLDIRAWSGPAARLLDAAVMMCRHLLLPY